MLKARTSVATGETRPAAWAGRLRSILDVRYLAVASAVATYALIVLGGVVRATDSGLACPDWPRCHGQFIPPLETAVLIEFSHRLAAASVGLLIVGTAAAAWLWRRDNRFVLAGTAMAVVLVTAQAVIGGVTVNMELPETIVALHLSMALIILGILIATAVGAFWQDRAVADSAGTGESRVRWGSPVLTALAALATLALMVVGSYVANSGAGFAYSDWPLFDGKLWTAGGRLANLHYAHRLIAAAVGLLIAGVAVRMWRRERRPVPVAALAFALVLYAAQVFVGAGNVWLDMPASTRVVHLALAGLLWAALVFAAAWGYAERAARAEGRG